MKTKHCEACGMLFNQKRSNAKYCSPNCRQKAYHVRHKKTYRKLCAQCGQPFIANRSNQRCCTKAHKQALYRELKALDL